MELVKHSLISMITWIQVYWYDNSDSIEYTACIGDYPINDDMPAVNVSCSHQRMMESTD